MNAVTVSLYIGGPLQKSPMMQVIVINGASGCRLTGKPMNCSLAMRTRKASLACLPKQNQQAVVKACHRQEQHNSLMAVVAVKSDRISVVIPVLNEAGCITRTLDRLQAMRRRGHELIVVDGVLYCSVEDIPPEVRKKYPNLVVGTVCDASGKEIDVAAPLLEISRSVAEIVA